MIAVSVSLIFAVLVVAAVAATLIIIGKLTQTLWIPALVVLGVLSVSFVLLLGVRSMQIKRVYHSELDGQRREAARIEAIEAESSRAAEAARRNAEDIISREIEAFDETGKELEILPEPVTADEVDVPIPVPPQERVAGATVSAHSPVPAWFERPAGHDGETFETVIQSGPHARLMDCQIELDRQLVLETQRYMAEELNLGESHLVHLSSSDLRGRVVADEFVTAKMHDFGPLSDEQKMYQVFQLVQFDAATNGFLKQLEQKAVVENRLWYAGSLLGAAILALTTVFSYIKVDNATGGKYRSRLRLAAGAVMTALAGSMAALIKFVPLA